MDETEIDLIEKLNKLSPEMKEIVFWIVDNIDFVNHICRGKAMRKEKWERYLEHAIINKDNLGIALLAFKHIKDEKGMIKKKKDNT